jgi:protein-S-isoprenylcysteine O-methyltransferase Ste14
VAKRAHSRNPQKHVADDRVRCLLRSAPGCANRRILADIARRLECVDIGWSSRGILPENRWNRRYRKTVRPLIWTAWQAAVAGAVPFASLIWTEARSLRRVPDDVRAPDDELDSATGRLFDLLAGVALASGLLISFAIPALTINPRIAALVVGVVLMCAAIALSAAARRHLGRFHRHVLTAHHDHELIDTGPYQLVRHPIYLATVMAFAGIGGALGNWLSLALCSALPTSALVRRIAVEENILRNRLGPAYETYSRRSARLFPGIW